ncbi:hypothetical protein D3C85_1557660 [compost metagenome]
MNVCGITKKDLNIIEQLRCFKVFGLSGNLVQMGHRFVHAAIFAGNVGIPHFNERFLWQLAQTGIYPIAHVGGNFECFFIACYFVHIY